jgi:hypothetical protein
MSDKILKHLRSAQALSQSGRCVESARVIISALNALCCSSEASSFQPQQARHLMDSLAPLLKYAYYAHTPSYFMLPTLFTATPSKLQWTRSTCPFPTCCSCTYRLFHATRTIPMYVAVLMLCFTTLAKSHLCRLDAVCNVSTSKNGRSVRRQPCKCGGCTIARAFAALHSQSHRKPQECDCLTLALFNAER